MGKSKNTISEETVKYLAKLVKLTLTDEEVEAYGSDFSETIKVMDKLSELNVEGIQESPNPSNLENVTFSDGEPSRRTFSQEDALANASETDGSNFIVTKILDK